MSRSPRYLAGGLFLLGLAAVIGWGLWRAAQPVKVPLQGQVEATTLNVTAKISARIASVPVREGQAVQAGQLLATLDSPEVRARQSQAEAARSAAQARLDLVREGAREEDRRAAEANWRRAQAASELAEKTYARVRALFEEKLIAQQRHDEAQTQMLAAQAAERAARAQFDLARSGARRQEKDAAGALAAQAAGAVAEVEAAAAEVKLAAPRAAEVDKVVLREGELAPAGFPILTLVDLQDVWVSFNLREDDFAGLKMGSELLGTVPALGGAQVRLRVDYLSPRGEFATWRPTRLSGGYDVKTFEVRARPVSPVEGLRPGMSVLIGRE